MAADKAYSSRGNRACLRRRGIKAVIPEKAGHAADPLKEVSLPGPMSTRDRREVKLRSTSLPLLVAALMRRIPAAGHDTSLALSRVPDPLPAPPPPSECSTVISFADESFAYRPFPSGTGGRWVKGQVNDHRRRQVRSGRPHARTERRFLD